MLHLDSRDARPIYEQVVAGLRRMIVLGGIAPGERLPSVRQLAASLAINPNTIAKAYEALEAEGYLTTEQGRGSFAAECPPGGGPRTAALLARFDETARELLYLGERAEALRARICPETERSEPHD